MNRFQLMKLRKRLLALSMAGVMVATSGCAQNDKKYEEETNISTENFGDNEITYYNEKPEVLDVPQNLTLDENYMASWDEVENADMYKIRIQYEDNGKVMTDETLYESGNIKKGKVYYNLEADILNGYKELELYEKEVKVSFSVYANVSCSRAKNFLPSEYSSYSNEITYSNEKPEKLDVPQNLTLDENYIATWDKVEDADMYKIRIQYEDNGKVMTYETLYESGNIKKGKVYYNLEADILNGYKELELYEKEVKVSFSVYANASCSRAKNFLPSEYSSYSNEIAYINNESFDVVQEYNDVLIKKRSLQH